MILPTHDEKTLPPSYYGESDLHSPHHSSPKADSDTKLDYPGPSDATTRHPFFREPSSDNTLIPSDGYNYHTSGSNKHTFDDSQASLMHNAADISRSSEYQDLEYAEPVQAADQSTEKKSSFASFMAKGKYPIQQRIEDKKRGIGGQKYPFVVWTLTAVMIGVFIYELVVNSRAQGTPVSMKPVVNPMLGPSSNALINLGARFPPCMKQVDAVPPSTKFGCLNNTANPPDQICTLEEICGFGGFIHILLNMLAQLTLSAQIEREMGSTGFLITYFAAGIFGCVSKHISKGRLSELEAEMSLAVILP
ncbi:hypothetical protein H0H87_009173 [Tephrocybe sp. NHM501043]|nr:hypothetical protein H0H87_009173 [Tephrocybe sp. NHM501043]